jgi:hypothetical protein
MSNQFNVALAKQRLKMFSDGKAMSAREMSTCLEA